MQVYDAISEFYPDLTDYRITEIIDAAIARLVTKSAMNRFKLDPPDRVTLVLSQKPGSKYLKAQIDHTRAVTELKQMDNGVIIWRFPVLRDDVERIIAEDLKDYHITRLPDIEEENNGTT